MQTIEQEGRVLELDGQPDGVRAGEEEVGERGGLGEALCCERDVVEGGEEEAGAGFGDGDGGEARGEEARVADGPAAVEIWAGGGTQGGVAGGGFAFGCGGGGVGEAGDGSLVDAGLVVEEDVDVVEAGAEFVGEDFEVKVGVDHGDDVLLDDDKALARQPDNVVVELERFRVSRVV